MNTKKVVLITVVSNIVLLGLLVGVFAITQTAQAKGANAPATTSRPQEPTLGPFYVMFSSLDFRSFDDTLFTFGRAGFGMFSQTSGAQVFAAAPVHLPPNATITELWMDAFDNSSTSSLMVSLQSCAVTRGGCDSLQSVTSQDGGRKQGAAALSYSPNTANESLILIAQYNNVTAGSGDPALYLARIAYTLPSSALFMPAIIR